jgi:hypothetical protein
MLAGNPAITFPGDFESIATTTLTTAAATITFSSIPQTYSHLQLRYIARNDTSTYFVRIRFNGSTTTTDYVYHVLNGSGSAVTVGHENDGMYAPRQSTTANIFGAGVVDILDYTNTNKYKTIRGLGGYDANGSGDVDFLSGFYKANTSAITSIEITVVAGNYTQYSQFALYGIRSA